jgi:hypothetical protein
MRPTGKNPWLLALILGVVVGVMFVITPSRHLRCCCIFPVRAGIQSARLGRKTESSSRKSDHLVEIVIRASCAPVSSITGVFRVEAASHPFCLSFDLTVRGPPFMMFI